MLARLRPPGLRPRPPGRRLPLRRGLAAVAATLAVVATAVPGVAYEQPSGSGTGVTGLNGVRHIPYPSGMQLSTSVNGNQEVQEGLTLSTIGEPRAAHYDPQIDPARGYAIKVQSLPQQNCAANSVCFSGNLFVRFKHPVHDPVLNFAGIGANTGGEADPGTSVRLTLLDGDGGATLRPASAGATLRVDGQTVRPLSNTSQFNCSNANAALRAGCGSVPVRGDVSTMVFRVDFVTQGRAVNAASGSAGADAWALSAMIRDDCSNAPSSYGNASHVVSDLALGPDVTEDNQNTALTAACRREDDENDMDPDFPELHTEMSGQTYSVTVPVRGVSKQAYAAAWLDVTGDGSFSDARRAVADVAPGADSVTFTWTLPEGIKPGNTWTRFRLGYTADQVRSATGMADSGEVEDWPLRVVGPPALSLKKSASPQTVAKAGEKVTYSFEVTNTGDVPVRDVKVDEGTFTGTGTAPQATCPAGTLEPGDSVTCTAEYTVTQADADAGSVRNTATATGTPPPGRTPPVSDESTTTVTADPDPSLTLRKSASETDELTVGQTVTYSFEITNTGNVTLTDVGVSDHEFSGSGGAPDVTCPDAARSLAPGAKVTCTAEYTVTQADADAGSIDNKATASGTPPGGGTPVESPPSSTRVPFDPKPSLEVEKEADKKTLVAGETVTYTFTVTNTGNVTLSEVTVSEGEFSGSGKMSAIDCPDGAPLAPGAQLKCTATYVVTQADVDAGRVDNSATATGTPPSGPPVGSPPGTTTVPGDPDPSLSIVKSSDKEELVVGETITYSFTVTNTGNVTLTDVTVDEGEFNGSGTMSEPVCPDGAKSLAPGDQVVCTATYTVTQADADRGTLRNTATATGTPPGGTPPVTSPPTSVQVPHDSRPALSMTKEAAPDTVHEVGDVVTYTFTITNTGNVTVRDVRPAEGAFSGTGELSPISCGDEAAALEPGERVHCTATYVLTQADVDAGKVTNTATATGTPPSGPPVGSPPVSTEVDVPPAPGLDLAKSAESSNENKLVAGETVTYSFLLTNTGNVTLDDLSVDEGEFSGTGKMSPVDCPVTKLAAGATTTCTATYVVTQADVDSGSLTNTATATGTPPGGAPPVTSPPADARVPARHAPGLKLAKSASTDRATRAGQVITYTFTVTNTGNVSLRDIAVKEGEFNGHGKLGPVECPATGSLAPGGSVDCTAAYTVVAADLTGKPLRNTATASGTGPGGEPVVSEPGRATVDTEPEPVPPPVGQPGPGPKLPETGTLDGTVLTAYAAAMLAAGGLVLLFAKRRRARR
ncbi:GEVED domain-containing protein [Streptomyces sp. NPDC050504]|uniref:COG1361 S-layer family protein n=1 Tax=Streptomyces sp. NPDC050504 TaxID=3365618 RepID=UPI0037B95646